MPLTAGQKIGVYEVTGPLGAGGMGEVYRARDSRLGRDVALKILPAAFASDPERLARFEREAQVLAALNHPHIAAIHGLEEGGAVRALVMELVDGQTLAERISGRPLPVDEALAIAAQIADALEAAHEQGIVHRDLKPANIKITPGGSVKVLDFGLAKMVRGAEEEGPVTQFSLPGSHFSVRVLVRFSVLGSGSRSVRGSWFGVRVRCSPNPFAAPQPRVSGISCVGHSMRSSYAPQAETPVHGGAARACSV